MGETVRNFAGGCCCCFHFPVLDWLGNSARIVGNDGAYFTLNI